MALANVEIKRAMDMGLIKIDPEPPWIPPPGEESLFDVDSVTALMGYTVIELQDIIEVDNVAQDFRTKLAREGRRVVLNHGERYPVRPWQPILIHSLQRVATAPKGIDGFGPFTPNCGGVTRNARFFVTAEFAPFLHNGCDNYPTFELMWLMPDGRPFWRRMRHDALKYVRRRLRVAARSAGISWQSPRFEVVKGEPIFWLTAGVSPIGQFQFVPLVGEPEIEGRGGKVRTQTSPCGNGCTRNGNPHRNGDTAH